MHPRILFSPALLIGIWTACSLGCSARPNSTTDSSKADSKKVGVKANSPTGGTSETLSEIPFVLTERNNITVSATINNVDKVTLMFHTANDGVVLTEEASKRVTSMMFDKTAKMKSWGGESGGRISENNSLEIGTFSWENLRIFQDRLSGAKTDGKFGPDLFNDKVIEVDFDSRKLIIHSSLPKLPKDFEKLKLEQKNGMMFLTASVKVENRNLENKFLIHSGFGGSILLDDEFTETNDIGKLQTLSESELRDSGGNVLKTRKVKLPSIKIGSFELANIPAQIFDGAIRKQKMSIIGGDILKRFNFVVDNRESTIYLQKSQLFAAAFGK